MAETTTDALRRVVVEWRPEVLAMAKAAGMWWEPSLCPDCDREEVIFYMVHDEVWAESGLSLDDGWHCPPCLAKRLGRPLMPDDFDIWPATLETRIVGEFKLPPSNDSTD